MDKGPPRGSLRSGQALACTKARDAPQARIGRSCRATGEAVICLHREPDREQNKSKIDKKEKIPRKNLHISKKSITFAAKIGFTDNRTLDKG